MPNSLRRLTALFIAILLATPGLSHANTELFSSVESRIYQVRILHKDTERRRSLGSGYLARRGDLLITNYHVVAGYLDRPGQSIIKIYAHDGQSYDGEVLGIDAAHDLAVIQLPKAIGPPFELGPSPAKGERLFAMGNPLDLGITLSEGTNNGSRQAEGDPNLLLSMTLNPGMSGGPTFNAQSQVVGTNVARAGDDLSLIIPANLAAALLDRVTADNYQRPKDFQQEIASQIASALSQQLDNIFSQDGDRIELNGFQLPGAFGEAIRCWDSSKRPKPDDLLKRLKAMCQNRHSIYLNNRFDMGELRYEYIAVKSLQADPLRFNHYYQGINSSQLHAGGNKESHSRFRCLTRFVNIAQHPFKTTWCERDYKRFPGLNDGLFTAALVGAGQQGLIINIDFIGIPTDASLKVVHRLLEQIQWHAQ